MHAIPSKRPVFTFGATFEGLSTFDLCGDTLYIFYTLPGDAEPGPRQMLRTYDLNTHDGQEWAGPNRMERNTAMGASCDTRIVGDAYIICGDTPELLDRHSFALRYSERDGQLKDGWDAYSWIHCWNGVVYRFVDFSEPATGVDVVRLGDAPQATEHLDLDINLSGAGHGQYVAGLRESGGAAVYALEDRRYVFQAAEHGVTYRQDRQDNGVAFDGGHRVFFLLGDTVLVGDTATGEVLHDIKYMASPRFQQYLAEHGRKAQDSFASELAVLGDKVFLGGTYLRGYLLCIDLVQGEVLWLQPCQHEINTLIAQGGLVYGVAALIPSAWDIHTGEQVWASEEGIRGYRVQINDRWLVIAGSKGDTQCYALAAPGAPRQPG